MSLLLHDLQDPFSPDVRTLSIISSRPPGNVKLGCAGLGKNNKNMSLHLLIVRPSETTSERCAQSPILPLCGGWVSCTTRVHLHTDPAALLPYQLHAAAASEA